MRVVGICFLLFVGNSCTPESPEKPTSSTEGRTLEIEYTLSEEEWLPVRKIRYSYSEAGLLEHQLVTGSSDYSNWENNSQFYFRYNDNEDLRFVERSVWRNENWHKVVSSSFSYTNKLISTRIDSAFLPTEEINITEHKYSYNDNDLVIEELAERITTDGKTVTSRLLHTYNDDELVSEKKWQSYQDGEWVNLRRMVFSYDEELNHIQTLRQNWQENEWKNFVRYLLTVNEKGKRTDALWQRYSENTWQDFRKVTYEY